MTSTTDELPDNLRAALASPDVEVPGEQRALAKAVRWVADVGEVKGEEDDRVWHLDEELEPCGSPFEVRPFLFTLDSSERRDLEPETVLVKRAQRSPWFLICWQPLKTWAPGPEKSWPCCCYSTTIVFYERPFQVLTADGKAYREWSRAQHLLLSGFGDHFFEYENGACFKLGSGRVVWRRGRWWFRFWARFTDICKDCGVERVPAPSPRRCACRR